MQKRMWSLVVVIKRIKKQQYDIKCKTLAVITETLTLERNNGPSNGNTSSEDRNSGLVTLEPPAVNYYISV